MADTVLKTEGVKKVIGKKTIVSDISLELYRGEIFGFLGPNGAGKTTTIKMIVGLSKITEGKIYVGGCSVQDDFKGAMKNIGCIVENPDLYTYMSGLDNLRLFAKMYPGISEERIREVVKIVDLERAINDKVKTYSLGMKQRLGIAQALLHSPKLLVLDEPTNGLDPAGIKEMRELLRELAEKTGLTVFVSSHILAEMQQMCDRVGIINRGRLITVKTVEELVGMAEEKTALQLDTNDNEKANSILREKGFSSELMADGVHVVAERENIPVLVRELTLGDVGIYAMDRSNSRSLEDVFMKLTEPAKEGK